MLENGLTGIMLSYIKCLTWSTGFACSRHFKFRLCAFFTFGSNVMLLTSFVKCFDLFIYQWRVPLSITYCCLVFVSSLLFLCWFSCPAYVCNSKYYGLNCDDIRFPLPPPPFIFLKQEEWWTGLSVLLQCMLVFCRALTHNLLQTSSYLCYFVCLFV